MKITYEVGDYVELHDDMRAGKLALCIVILRKKVGPTKWEVEDSESDNKDTVDEEYFIPLL
jgi:hypothetical protein